MRAASCGDPVCSSGAADSSGAVAASPVVHQGAEREEYAGAQCAHEPSSVGSVGYKARADPNDFVEGWDRWVRRSEAAGFAEQHGYEFIADE